MRLPDQSASAGEWDDNEETTFYRATPDVPLGNNSSQILPPRPPPPIPLMKRITPVEIADGAVRRPLLTLGFRDLLICAPWAFAFGICDARFGWPMGTAILGAASFGVLFDRVLRRWV